MDCTPSSPVPSSRSLVLGWLFFLLLTLGLQYWHAAYQSDLAGDPDEAAHAVTSVMLRDYLTQAPGSHPLRFAEAYYARLPKVALGHYPPAYYLVAGAWLLPLVSIQSMLVLQTVLMATLATFLVWCAGRLMPSCLAFACGLLVCISAPMEKIAVLVMSDVLLAIACLLAGAAFASYLDKPRVKAALGFGLAASFAILTKGSGWMLALLPPLAIALTGRWKLLIKPSLWIAPVPVIVLALPWQIFSYHLTAEGMSELKPSEYLKQALPYYYEAGVDSFGIVLVALLGLGLLGRLVQMLRAKGCAPMEACFWGLVISGVVMALFVPSGFSSRYFIPIVAPMIALAVLTVRSLMPNTAGGILAVVLAAVSLGLGLANKKIAKLAHGFHEVIAQVAQAPGTTLICADARGEGALVADAAFNAEMRSKPPVTFIRASKELASQDWIGRGYVTAFHDDKDLLAHLKKREVRWILLDDSVTGVLRQAHFDQLKHALQSPGSGWQMKASLPVVSSDVDQGSLLIFTPQP